MCDYAENIAAGRGMKFEPGDIVISNTTGWKWLRRAGRNEVQWDLIKLDGNIDESSVDDRNINAGFEANASHYTLIRGSKIIQIT